MIKLDGHSLTIEQLVEIARDPSAAVERDAIVAVPQSVEVIGDARHLIDPRRRIGHAGE